jgi:hypothetical protein
MSDGIQFIQIDFQKNIKNIPTKNTKGKQNLLQDPFVHRSFCDAPLRVLDLIGHVAAADPGQRSTTRALLVLDPWPSSPRSHRIARVLPLLAGSLARCCCRWLVAAAAPIHRARTCGHGARTGSQPASTHARARARGSIGKCVRGKEKKAAGGEIFFFITTNALPETDTTGTIPVCRARCRFESATTRDSPSLVSACLGS